MPLADDVIAIHPWIGELGIPPATLDEWLATYAEDPYGLVEAVRSSPQWAARYPSLRDPITGQLRDGMSEADYIAREAQYRQLMSYYGDATYRYDDPSDFSWFFENDVQPSELESRFTIYNTLDQASTEIKQAFYVYGGMDVTTDDLYTAIVAGSIGDAGGMYRIRDYRNLAEAVSRSWLMQEYEAKITADPPDYETWATRLTTFTLQQAQQMVSTDPTMSSTVVLPTPEQAREVLDKLYASAQVESVGRKNFGVPQIEQAYRLALVGSTATRHGFELPTEQRLTHWLEAGVQRANALQAYAATSTKGAAMRSQLARAGFADMDATSLAEGLMQGGSGEIVNAQLTTRLTLAESAAQAKVVETGAAQVGMGRAGRLEQQGIREVGATR
jgi:hypothetical protein